MGLAWLALKKNVSGIEESGVGREGCNWAGEAQPKVVSKKMRLSWNSEGIMQVQKP